jgi:DNA integrity scanning protein DisA with diadenylate cyclase activity
VFPLQTVSWLIRNVLAYVVIARDRAVPVGHPPRAVAHRPRAVLPVLRAERAAQETIEEVLTARPAREVKTGAIIVFERVIGLRNYVESGIPSTRPSATTC